MNPPTSVPVAQQVKHCTSHSDVRFKTAFSVNSHFIRCSNMQRYLWKIVMQIQTRLSIMKVSLYPFQAQPHPFAGKKPDHWSTEVESWVDQCWRGQTLHDETNGGIKLHELRASSARARPKQTTKQRRETLLRLTHGWANNLLFVWLYLL